MEKIVKNLTKIASNLDSRKQIKLASQIDKFSDSLMQIKTAQYVGIQGYWIRNERCWSNCYRQKRAKTPDKASQVIWQECQNEYVESINNPTSGWEKYAADVSLKKFASKHQKELIETERKIFNDAITRKVANGMAPVIAVYDTIEQRKTSYINEQTKLANSMLEFAEEISKEGFEKEAKAIALEANEIIKEAAGFWGNAWEGVKGKGESYQRMLSAFEDKVAVLKSYLGTIQKKLEASPEHTTGLGTKDKALIRQVYEDGRNYLQTYENNAHFSNPITSRQVNKIQNRFEKEIRPIITSVETATDAQSLASAATQGITTLDQILQATQQTQQIKEKTPDVPRAGFGTYPSFNQSQQQAQQATAPEVAAPEQAAQAQPAPEQAQQVQEQQIGKPFGGPELLQEIERAFKARPSTGQNSFLRYLRNYLAQLENTVQSEQKIQIKTAQPYFKLIKKIKTKEIK